MTTTQTQNYAAAEPIDEWRPLYVQAAFVEDFDPDYIYPEDWAAPGYYEVMVPADMDDTTAAGCAMGGFHSTVPIKHLDVFEFTVYDESGHYELEPDYDQDCYELAERCGKVFCCSKEFENHFTEAAEQGD